MTPDAARRTANVLLVAACVAATCLVVKTPRLKRLATRVARLWLGASVPAYLSAELARAWVESGRA